MMLEFSELFQNDIPLIDVRAPVEFEAGHFPNSFNLPLMNNQERHLVGTCYRESGQEAAIALGHQLVNSNIKDERVNAWLDFIKNNPSAKLYCFRGGLRSQISQRWIREGGLQIDIIPGGYKALRRFLIETLNKDSKSDRFMILAGRTGSGKTDLLKRLNKPFIDLEKHANHRGSSFGALGIQPSQISFENRIAVDLLKNRSSDHLFLEDESIMIGSLVIPRILFDQMRSSPMVLLEVPIEERVSRIVNEYVIQGQQKLDFMQKALKRIEKKLGGLNFGIILKEMNEAYQAPLALQAQAHRPWVEKLLLHYYDPFYDRGLKRNESRIVFRGNESECIQFMNSNPGMGWEA